MAVATDTTFTGFRPEAIQFLVDLAANNERAWFQPRKAEYERLLKEPLEALCVALGERVPGSAASRSVPIPRRRRSGSTATSASPRTSRRTRRTSGRASRGPATDAGDATAGRTPRTSTRAAAISTSSRARSTSAAAIWHPEKAWLDAFRRRVVDEPAELRRSIEAPAFRDAFGSLSGTAMSSSGSRRASRPTIRRPRSSS